MIPTNTAGGLTFLFVSNTVEGGDCFVQYTLWDELKQRVCHDRRLAKIVELLKRSTESMY